MRRNSLSSWILMIVLVGAALIFLFFILLSRANNLAGLEPTPTPTATPEPSAMVIDYERPAPQFMAIVPGERPGLAV